MRHTVEIEELVNDQVWMLRLNGDGSTFDAVCVITRIDPLTIYACAALSLIPGGITELTRLSKPYFKEKGYTHYQYIHNTKPIRRKL